MHAYSVDAAIFMQRLVSSGMSHVTLSLRIFQRLEHAEILTSKKSLLPQIGPTEFMLSHLSFATSLQSLLEEAEASQADSSAAAAAPLLQQQQQQQGRRDSLGAPPSTPAPARRESFSLSSMLKKQKASISWVLY